jgi:(R,R)-butanediol dehydrogenase / meso-butanediol dehydrogenase / diacetyl reductase
MSPPTVPETMPAAVYTGDGRMEVQELPVPEPGPGQVLVEISACGICGSDLHLVLEKFATPGDILGHEWSGTVVGSRGSDTGWEPGARIVSDTSPGCGRCRACLSRRPAVCLDRPPADFSRWNGAFCRYRAVDAGRLLRIPENLPSRLAALTEPTAIAIHAVNVSGARPGDRVLLTGAGPVGALILSVLKARGIDDLTVSEPSPTRRGHAERLGAREVVTPEELQPAQMGRTVERPYSVVFECSGHASAIESGLDQLDYAGTLVLVGTGTTTARINQNRMIILEQTITAAFNYDPEGFGPALELLAGGSLRTDLLVEEDDVNLDQIVPTMQRLASGEIAGKVLVRPELSL